MRVRCNNCLAEYNVDDSRIPPQGVSINCPKCQNTFVVIPGGGAEAVPLPSAAPGGGAVPLPGAPGGAVPLPGMPGGAASAGVPLPGAPGGAVPLPGMPGFAGGVPRPPSAPPPIAPPAPVNPAAAVGMPAPRSSAMGDMFGDTGAAPSLTNDSIPSHPFHGDSVVAQQRGGGLSDFIDQQAPAAPRAASASYQIRRRSGAVSGPFDTPTLIAMLRKQELAGNEEASTDGRNWRALSQIPVFSEEIQAIMAQALGALGSLDGLDLPGLPNADLPGLPNADLPGLPNTDLPGLPNSDLPGLGNSHLPGLGSGDLPGPRGSGGAATYSPHGGGMDFMSDIGASFGGASSDGAVPEGFDGMPPADGMGAPMDPLSMDLAEASAAAVKVRGPRRKRAKASPLTILLAVGSFFVVVIIAGGIFVGLATDYGFFGHKWVGEKLFSGTETPPEDPVDVPAVDLSAIDIDELLDRDHYAGLAQALLVLGPHASKSQEAAVRLARVYADMALLDDDVSGIPAGRAALAKGGEKADGPEGVRAAAIFDILEGKCGEARTLLDGKVGKVLPEEPNVEQVDLLALKGLAYSCGKDPDVATAAGWADRALVAAPRDGFALWAQARIAANDGDHDTAVGYLERLVEVHPSNARASLHLAEQLLQIEGRRDEATAAFQRAVKLGGKSLAPWQMGRASLGLAKIHQARREFQEAEKVATVAYESVGAHLPTLLQIGDFALDLYLFDLAQKVFKKAVSANADNREAVVGLARALAASRNQLEAYEALNRLLKANPNDAYLTYWMGQIQLAMIRRDEARGLFEKAWKLDPTQSAPLVALVEQDLRVGDYSSAQRKLLKRREKVAPEQQGAIDVVQAEVHHAFRRFPEALASLQKAEDAGEPTPFSRGLRARVLIDDMRPKEAAAFLPELLADNPTSPWVMQQMGYLLLHQDKAREAMAMFEKAGEAEQTEISHQLLKAAAQIALKDFDGALETIQAGSEVEPTHIDILYWQGLAQRGKEDYKNALATFKRGEQLAPDDARFSLEVGVTFSMKGDFIDAVDYFKSAAIKDKRWALVSYHLGKTYMELVRYRTAREMFEQALRQRPDWAEAHLMLGETIAKAGDYKGALAQYKKAIEADPNYIEAHCRSGWVLKNNGKLKDAEVALAKCIKGNPKHPEALKWMGFIYKDTKRRDQAIEIFQRHLRYNPDDLDADLVRDSMQGLR